MGPFLFREPKITCIAWDGLTLAADKRATVSSLNRTTTKIHRVGKTLVGYCGDADQGLEMLAWIRKGAKPVSFPTSQRNKDDWAATLVISPGSVIQLYERTPYPIRYEDKQYAIGSGRDYALAAMHLGKTAKEAVEVACFFDPGCGNGVDTLRLKP